MIVKKQKKKHLLLIQKHHDFEDEHIIDNNLFILVQNLKRFAGDDIILDRGRKCKVRAQTKKTTLKVCINLWAIFLLKKIGQQLWTHYAHECPLFNLLNNTPVHENIFNILTKVFTAWVKKTGFNFVRHTRWNLHACTNLVEPENWEEKKNRPVRDKPYSKFVWSLVSLGQE